MKTLFVAAGVAAALAGCGGDDDGGNLNCSDFSACGGNPVGEWTIVDACIDGAPQPDIDGCPEASAAFDDVVVSGTVEIREDGSYATSVNTMATLILTVPMSCLDGATCAQLSEAAGVPCTAEGDACDCTSELDESDQETGTWETSGSTISLTDSDDMVSESTYCVEGDVLKAQQQDDPGDPVITFVMTR
jgi:hypothetical protein